MSEHFKTNPAAERILNAVATVLLVIGIIISLACIIGGIYFIYDYEEEIGIPLLIGGILFIIIELISWACFKVIINISQNLFNIDNNTMLLNQTNSVLNSIQNDIQSIKATINKEQQ